MITRRHLRTTTAAALAISLFCVATSTRGDVFILNNGGRIEGQLVDGGDNTDYVIETPTGRMTIARAQVARIDTTSADEKQYDEIAKTAPDTVEAQWKLYEWCRSHKLREQAQKHLTRVLELDPNHAEARSLLGFRKQGDSWVTRDDVMASRGLVKHEGQYFTKQHLELLEQQKGSKDTQVTWRRNLTMWRGWLLGRREDRATEARTKIKELRDPLAAEPVATMLSKEADPALQQMWLEALARINSPAATSALIDHSLNDANEEIRHQSLEYLIASDKQGLIAPYVLSLKSGNDVIISRAAAALGEIGDPAAIGPLIDVLIIVRKEKVDDNEGRMNMSMTRGNGGMSMGSSSKVVSREIKNADVRTALLRLTRIPGFEYDQDAWRDWYAAQAKAHRVDMRRDQ